MAASSSSSFTNPTARWQALQTRNPAAHAAFLYGARTTRIYCRPTCPGRLARRANVVFFDSLAHAHSAGYRPCIRCQPCNDGWDPRWRLACAKNCIARAVRRREAWTVEGVAREVGVSAAHLHRLFRRVLGVTPKGFGAGLEARTLDLPDGFFAELDVDVEAADMLGWSGLEGGIVHGDPFAFDDNKFTGGELNS